MDNDPYKIKLSVLRYQVSQELITVSGLLKDTTKLLKTYAETPNIALEKSVHSNILKSGESLDRLDNNMKVLKKRIEYIINNFVGDAQEKKAVENLALDIPQNTQNISMLKKHYLEIIGLYSKPGKTNEEYLNFTFLQNESPSNNMALDSDKNKAQTKKRRLSWF